MNIDIKIRIPLNLAFFNDGGEKTEQATPRKKRKAREEGQVLKSQEVSTAALFLSVFLGLRIFSSYMYERLLAIMDSGLELVGSDHIRTDINYVQQLINDSFLQVMLIALPIFAVAMVAGIVTNVIQVGWHPTTKPLMPKFDKISPLKGFKRIFSPRALIELVKSVLKLVVISGGIYMIVINELHMLPRFIHMELLESVQYVGDLVVNIGIMVGAMYIFIAGLDFYYQWYKHNKELKMSKQEIKEEYKQTEGNPQIKGQIRQKMREASMRRMMQQVPSADVIITNPTHYAVALKYDKAKGEAPIVVAKGVDYIAKRIKDKAKEHNIELVENKPLARTLYDTVEIDHEIPPELYQAVAEIFAYLVNINKIAV